LQHDAKVFAYFRHENLVSMTLRTMFLCISHGASNTIKTQDTPCGSIASVGRWIYAGRFSHEQLGRRSPFVHLRILRGIAATIELVDASGPLNMGSGPDGKPLMITFGSEKPQMRLTWLGVSSGQVSAEVARLLESSDPLDPLVLAASDWELGAFCCRQCRLNYCSNDWRTTQIFADDSPGWCEETRGVCPRGHEQLLDD
jgi:hypothetical protein